MPLAAFGYSTYSSQKEKKIFIVGGFDGKILHTQAWNIDLVNNTVTDVMLDSIDYGLSYSKVAYFKMEEKKEKQGEVEVLVHPKIEKLFIFGGYNSSGDSYAYDFLLEAKNRET